VKAWEYDLLRSRNTETPRGSDEAARILKRIIKDLKKELAEKDKKKPEEKKKDPEFKFSTLDWFCLITIGSFFIIGIETYWMLKAVTHLLDTVSRITH
jgi:hypothetical protein